MLTHLDISERSVILDEHGFGSRGPYEKILGYAHFEFDPTSDANKNITDIDKAPLNDRGMIEARSNIYVLQAVDPEQRANVAIFEIVNRGNKTLFNKLNRWVPGREHIEQTMRGGKRGGIPLEVGCMPHDPKSLDEFGDGWLMRNGFTIIWVGWEGDILPSEHQMYFEAPIAKGVSGIVRNLALVTTPTKMIALGQWGHRPYAAANPDDPHLKLVRQQPNTINGDEAEEVIPREQWRFAREQDGKVIPDATYLYKEDGFDGGVYRLVYESKDPPILGLGFAAVRDTAGYAKHNSECPFPVDQTISIGRSQTGRFQLDYLYAGVNGDEKGRRGLDGMIPHTGGAGRGSFNVRFGQPTTGCNHFAATLFPVDMFPFTAESQVDPYTSAKAGRYDKTPNTEHLPKVFHVNTGWEYWARGNSLLHTSVDGERDAEEAEHERHYFFSGTQHSVEMTPFPPNENTSLPESLMYRGNFQDYHFALRALVVRLVEWIRDGAPPPESRVPTHSRDELKTPKTLAFPKIQNAGSPADVAFYEPWVLDYGERFEREGVIDIEPPKRFGKSYPCGVSDVDENGNEVAGIRTLEMRAPLATYTPWRRWDYPNSFTAMTDYFTGSVIPFPRNDREKAHFNDPRPAISSLYSSKDDFLESATREAQRMSEEGFLLKDDIDANVALQASIWDWIFSRPDYSNGD
ncbi:MAG: alpha/beta hydrolase domain-containing protein [Pseudomonadota bacterium]